MMQPLISAIVPVYNGEQYIQRLIDMFKKQTYQNLEIIIVNDGSTDNTKSLCDAGALQDSRFRVFHKKNGGPGSARNYGLSKATGAYVGFVDADDYIFPDYFSYLFDLITKYDADMSCCGYCKTCPGEKVPSFSGKKNKELLFTGHQASEYVWYRKYLTGYPCLKLYKKEILDGIEFSESLTIGEDQLFTVDAVARCNRVVYGNRILYVYYQNLSSLTHDDHLDAYETTWFAFESKLAQYKSTNEEGLLAAAQTKCFIWAIDSCCRFWNNKDLEAKKHVQELLLYIRSVCGGIFRDRNCKAFNRFLSFLCCISTPATVFLCRLYTKAKVTFKLEPRHSL